MNVSCKRTKKIAEVSLSEHKIKSEIYFAFSLTLLWVNFTAINQESFNKNIFLKISQHSSVNTYVVNIIFHKVAGLQSSGLQNKCFLIVNNMNFLRAPILKNICLPPNSAFFKLILWGSWKKTHPKNKVTETYLQIWKYFYLNPARGYEKKSLKYVIKFVQQPCAEQLISDAEFGIDTDKKSTPVWILYHF